MHPIILDLKNKKEYLTKKEAPLDVVRVHLKEDLQNYVLDFLYNNLVAKELIFYGGSCLRKIFGLNRLSEDLDFEVSKKPDLSDLGANIKHYFHLKKFDGVDFSVQEGELISRLTIKFPVLFAVGLSPHKDEKLHVTIEINDNLTGEYETKLSPFTDGQFSILVKHYELETIMACKMVAALERVFKKSTSDLDIKGRDYYDLIWFMQKGVKPNEEKLKDVNRIYTVEEVFRQLDEKVAKIKYRDLYSDLRLVFEDPVYIKEWCKNFHDFYNRYRTQYN